MFGSSQCDTRGSRSSSHTASRVVIVGGGTAGWLAALMLKARLGGSAHVQVIESSDVPTIGVGEGSTGLLPTVLRSIKINEDAFLQAARATLKLGIIHKDWRRPGFTHCGPIDNPSNYVPALRGSDVPIAQAGLAASGRRIVQSHLNGWLIERGGAPAAQSATGIELLPSYAYHFDAAAVARHLFKEAQAREIQTTVGTVSEVRRSANGNITALALADGRSVTGDWFIDCTGFARALIKGAPATGWKSYTNELLVDAAVTFVSPHDRTGDIPNATLAWARNAGWIWGIPTADRIGFGYVYASSFISADEACCEVKKAIRRPLTFGRHLRFATGRLERFWVGNCIALGLAAAFAEPLEATSIHATLLQILLLQKALSDPNRPPTAADAYNRRVAAIYDDFKDFLVLHYLTRGRQTPFWLAAADAASASRFGRMTAEWAARFPRHSDFATSSGAISANLFLPILDGLGLLNRRTAGASLTAIERAAAIRLSELHKNFASRAISHRELLALLMRPQDEMHDMRPPAAAFEEQLKSSDAA
jgi:tryptophan halogenase